MYLVFLIRLDLRGDDLVGDDLRGDERVFALSLGIGACTGGSEVELGSMCGVSLEVLPSFVVGCSFDMSSEVNVAGVDTGCSTDGSVEVVEEVVVGVVVGGEGAVGVGVVKGDWFCVGIDEVLLVPHGCTDDRSPVYINSGGRLDMLSSMLCKNFTLTEVTTRRRDGMYARHPFRPNGSP